MWITGVSVLSLTRTHTHTHFKFTQLQSSPQLVKNTWPRDILNKYLLSLTFTIFYNIKKKRCFCATKTILNHISKWDFSPVRVVHRPTHRHHVRCDIIVYVLTPAPLLFINSTCRSTSFPPFFTRSSICRFSSRTSLRLRSLR